MTKINLPYAFTLSVLFFITLFTSFFFIDNYRDDKIHNILQQHIKTLETYYKILSYNQAMIANTSYNEIIENKQFMEVLSKANEAKNNNDLVLLNNLHKSAYEFLKVKYNLLQQQGVLQYNFVFPDNTVFLRMHKQDKYGDNLSTVREDFVIVNKSLEIIRGFAQGATSHGFRNVYPIINDNGVHLGAVEISFGSNLIQSYFMDINNIHTHFLVKKGLYNSNTWKTEELLVHYVESAEDKNYMLTMTPKHTVEKCIVENSEKLKPIKDQITQKLAQKKPFSLYTIFHETARIASFYPILHWNDPNKLDII